MAEVLSRFRYIANGRLIPSSHRSQISLSNQRKGFDIATQRTRPSSQMTPDPSIPLRRPLFLGELWGVVEVLRHTSIESCPKKLVICLSTWFSSLTNWHQLISSNHVILDLLPARRLDLKNLAYHSFLWQLYACGARAVISQRWELVAQSRETTWFQCYTSCWVMLLERFFRGTPFYRF